MAFEHPLPTNLNPTGDICVPLFIPDDPDYIALLVKAIRMLELDNHYLRDENKSALIVREQWRTRTITPLIDALAKGVHCGGCITMWPFHPAIEWFPNDPYLTPDLVPEGYVFPPWYVVGIVAQVLYDATLHSVITSIERLPAGSWPFGVPASGWPRFRINLNGAGTVEIHLSSIRLGSVIQIQVDGEAFGMEWVDVQQDQLAIPPETSNIIIIEREITTPGDHYIDCTVLPQLNDTPMPLSYGGGLVKVEICGFTPQFPGTGDDLQGLQMRLTAECGMEFSTDEGSEWQPVTGWDVNAAACFLGDAGATGLDGLDGTDGTDGDDGLDGTDGTDGDDGQTANEFPPLPDPATDEMCGAAWYIAEQMEALIQDAIVDAGIITLEEFLIALMGLGGFSGSFLVLFWDWLVVTVDETLSANINTGMDYVAEHLYCTSLDLEATKGLIAQDTEYSPNARTGWQMAIDSFDEGKIALWAFVGAQDTTRDCSSIDCGAWCHTFNFKEAEHDFVLMPFGNSGSAGTWESGQGWKAIATGGGAYTLLGKIEFAVQDITHAQIKVWWADIETSQQITMYGKPAEPPSDVLGNVEPSTPNSEYILTWDGSADYLAIPVWLAQQDSGQMWLTEMTIMGTGANPFGADNC